MLLGGNRKVQDVFYEYLTQSDVKNDFLLELISLIQSLFAKIKDGMEQKNKKHYENLLLADDDELFKSLRTTLTMITLTQDSQSPEKKLGTNETENEAILANTVLIRLLRMLQLFCEGHNNQMQNYLRVQKYQGRINGKTVNFLRHIAQIYGHYIKFVNVHCIDLGDQIIEFLIEALQGPCLQN